MGAAEAETAGMTVVKGSTLYKKYEKQIEALAKQLKELLKKKVTLQNPYLTSIGTSWVDSEATSRACLTL